MAVTLRADQVPAIQVPTLLDPDDSGVGVPAPIVDLTATSGVGSLTTPWKKNAKRLANVAQGGVAAAFAVRSGLGLSTAASLLLPIGLGCAIVNGEVFKPANFTQAVSGAIARVYLWLSSGGTVTPVNNSLTPPGGAQCFLGSCVTDSGNVLSVDNSGVMYTNGHDLWRYTADLGPPTDTPPAGLHFDNYSIDGVYHFDGTSYRPKMLNAWPNRNIIPANSGLYIPADYNLVMVGELDASAAELAVAGELLMIAQ